MKLYTHLDTPTHKIESAGAIYVPTKADIEAEWRDSELKKYDNKLQPDRPNADRILEYRQELRDYDLNGVRPTL